jgi:hypothetical protein
MAQAVEEAVQAVRLQLFLHPQMLMEVTVVLLLQVVLLGQRFTMLAAVEVVRITEIVLAMVQAVSVVIQV